MTARRQERDWGAQMFEAGREGMAKRDQSTEVRICVQLSCLDGAGVRRSG